MRKKESIENASALAEKIEQNRIKLGMESQKVLDEKISEILFERQEAGCLHNSLEWGIEIYENIKREEKKEIIRLFEKCRKWKYGILAEEELRSAKNAAICLLSFIAQTAIYEKLIDSELCYSVSDACIQMVECSQTKSEVLTNLYASCLKYMELFQSDQQNNYHYLVKRTKEYIYKHLHDEMTVNNIAGRLGVSAAYLSRIFRKAEGVTLKHYILEERINRGANLLKYSEYSILEISEYLGFATQSHFTDIFRKFYGITPGNYRKCFSELYKGEM